jgi:hypothetical protein
VFVLLNAVLFGIKTLLQGREEAAIEDSDEQPDDMCMCNAGASSDTPLMPSASSNSVSDAVLLAIANSIGISGVNSVAASTSTETTNPNMNETELALLIVILVLAIVGVGISWMIIALGKMQNII